MTPPYPDWALTDEALIRVAELLRAYHQAVDTFNVLWTQQWSDGQDRMAGPSNSLSTSGRAMRPKLSPHPPAPGISGG